MRGPASQSTGACHAYKENKIHCARGHHRRRLRGSDPGSCTACLRVAAAAAVRGADGAGLFQSRRRMRADGGLCGCQSLVPFWDYGRRVRRAGDRRRRRHYIFHAQKRSVEVFGALALGARQRGRNRRGDRGVRAAAARLSGRPTARTHWPSRCLSYSCAMWRACPCFCIWTAAGWENACFEIRPRPRPFNDGGALCK